MNSKAIIGIKILLVFTPGPYFYDDLDQRIYRRTREKTVNNYLHGIAPFTYC